ncbi:TlpA family protein disulfide reductase [Daejeonella oryzae]|uniref:TlpA family protein disulfide reductase n=1 Tax=Daejeonella oryzae TaxID=1122943 RepID=UPI00047D5D23|nr:TlpA family protein disulfide reductase [Daejeonella oryzae]
MKAKKSLMAVLWPFLKQKFHVFLRRFCRTEYTSTRSCQRLKFDLMAEELKESARRVEESKLRAEQYKLEVTKPYYLPGKSKKYHDKKEGGSDLKMSWREEDDRSTSFSLLMAAGFTHRPNKQSQPVSHHDGGSVSFGSAHDTMLTKLFLRDHDENQLEQYMLENNIVNLNFQIPQKPSNPFYRRIGFILLFFIATGAGQLHAQELDKLKPGDQVPDVTISNLINYKTGTAKISDFRGKLLILDFWNTWCKGCLESFEKADELQRQFGDQLQVLFITTQQGQEIQKFLLKYPRIAAFKNVIATGDIAMKKLFPYATVPHLVWISPEGKLIQTTESYDFNAQNIQKLLAKEQADFKAQKTDQLNFDTREPLFDRGNGGAAVYKYRSMITGFSAGLPGSIGVREDSVSVRLHALNQGVVSMYKKALNLPSYWQDNRVLYEGLERRDYEIGDWYRERQDKVWCYELILPLSFRQDLHLLMQQDLARFFKVSAVAEERFMDCLVLQVRDKKLIPVPSRGERHTNLSAAAGQEYTMKNDWISSFIEHLNRQPGMPPIIDESGITYTLNMELGTNISTIDSLNRALANYGLRLNKEKRLLKMMILSPAPINTNR